MPENIGPYEIQALLGRGGMGDVYEAYDARLDRRVALKVIQSRRLDHEVSRARFRREALAAASLKDPAIVHVYDVMSIDDRDCIVMELVEGKTLREIFEEKRLSVPEVLGLGVALAGALMHAHEKGIIHRDLKADNVMLLDNGSPKVLDFGLAKYTSEDVSTLSQEGYLLGTPHAMSPEQTRGAEVDHRSDLFSLGVVLYHALTGVSPFKGDNFSETIARIQTQRPRPVKASTSGVSDELSGFIDRLLAKKPADRPQTAREVRAAFQRFAGHWNPEGSSLPPETASVSAPVCDLEEARQKKSSAVDSGSISETVRREVARQLDTQRSERNLDRSMAKWGLRLLAVSIAAALYILLALALKPEDRPSVAVLGIDTVGPSALGHALSQLLTQELQLGGEIRVVESSLVSRRLRELEVGSFDELNEKDIERLGDTLNVDFLIWGSHERLSEETNNIAVQMDDASTGKRRLREAESLLGELQLGTFIEAVGQKVRRELRAAEATQRQLAAARRVIPEDLEAARLYATALEQAADYRFDEALRSYEAALEIEPDHPMILAGVAEAWATLGEIGKSSAAMEKARTAGADLPAVKTLELDGRACELRNDFPCAIEAYSSLFEQFPDDLGFGIRLANTRIDARELQRAGETLARLRELESRTGPDPRIDRVEARLSYFQGDYQRFAALVRSASELAEQREEWLLLADLKRLEAAAHNSLGAGQEQIRAAQEEARRLFQRFGDNLGLAKTLERIATFYFYRDAGMSQKLFEQAHRLYSDAGALTLARDANLKISKLLASRGQLNQAQDLLQSTLPDLHSWLSSSEMLRSPRAADQISDLGYIYLQLGDLDGAEESYEKVREFFVEHGNPSYVAITLFNLGELAFLRGRLDESKDLFDQAQAKMYESQGQAGLAYGHLQIGKVFAARGLYSSAREEYLRALDGPTSVVSEGEVLLAVAALSLRDDDSSYDPEVLARAREIFQRDGQLDLDRMALGVQTLASTMSGESHDLEVLVPLLLEGLSSENPRVRLALTVALARIGGFEGETSVDGKASMARLREQIEEATALGLVTDSLAARLAVFEINAATHGRILARDIDDLEALIEEARARDFGSITDRAGRLLGLGVDQPGPL